MKRLFESHLQSWKVSPNRKPLIIRGARQVGKTYIVDQLGKSSFKYYLKINPEKDAGLKSIFQLNNPQLIITELSALTNIPIIENETLLFIDEIQLLPEALVALRYFFEDMPGLHVIAAGSLLDHTLNELPYSMPVGRVEFAYLYPMNFVEFLMANNQNGLVDYLTVFTLEKTISEAIHQKISSWLRLYFFIGGMPEAVRIYAETENLLEIEKVHNAILTSFKYDFAKYGTRKQQEYLNECLEYVAGNIGRKVKYVNINKNAHSNYLKEALLKLELSRIIHLVRRTGSSKVPISQFVNKDVFKPIFLDIGLVCSLVGIKLHDIKQLIVDFEGALAEQFIGQELLTTFEYFNDARLYYWSREKKNANAEIDYLYQVKNNIYPIEVKAGKTGTLKSLQVYLGDKHQKTGIRFNLDVPSVGHKLTANININGIVQEVEYSLISMPLYLAYYLKQLI